MRTQQNRQRRRQWERRDLVEEEEEKEVMMKMMRMNELKMRDDINEINGRNIYFESIDFFEGNCRHMTVSCLDLAR